MMLAYRFVRLIETHAEALASGLLLRVESSKRIPSYREHVPKDELRQRVQDIYRHLGDWLLGKTESEIEQRYREIGSRRALQGVPLNELVWAIVLTKENLWDFLKREAIPERPVEVFAELEMLQMLDQFFDCAIYYATIGYQQVRPQQREVHAAVR
jgi:hypothetical protein